MVTVLDLATGNRVLFSLTLIRGSFTLLYYYYVHDMVVTNICPIVLLCHNPLFPVTETQACPAQLQPPGPTVGVRDLVAASSHTHTHTTAQNLFSSPFGPPPDPCHPILQFPLSSYTLSESFGMMACNSPEEAQENERILSKHPAASNRET